MEGLMREYLAVYGLLCVPAHSPSHRPLHRHCPQLHRPVTGKSTFQFSFTKFSSFSIAINSTLSRHRPQLSMTPSDCLSILQTPTPYGSPYAYAHM
jgi:hypothetical protein